MQLYKGDRRLFETFIEEDGSSTPTNRIIAIPGVNRLSEIKGCIIPVKAYTEGANGTTYVQINNLERKELRLFYVGDNPATPSHNWIRPGQVFNLVYTGEYFTVVGNIPYDFPVYYDFNFLNDSPVTGTDLSTYMNMGVFNRIKTGDTLRIYYDVKANYFTSVILSSVTWTNTYAVGKSCLVKTIAFLDFECNPVSIDLCVGNDKIVYYGNIPGYDVT